MQHTDQQQKRAHSTRAAASIAGLLLAAGCEFPGSSSPITIVSKNSQQPQLSNPTIGTPPGVRPPAVTTTTARPPAVTTTTARPPIVTTTTASTPAVTTTTQSSLPPIGPTDPALDPDLLTLLPSGFSLAIDNPHDSVAYRTGSDGSCQQFQCGGPGSGEACGQAPLRVVQDATAPDGDPSVLLQSYGPSGSFAGTGDGWEPTKSECFPGSTNELYLGMLFKFASTWEWPSSSGVKWLILKGSVGNIGWIGAGRPNPGAGSPSVGRLSWGANGGTEVPATVVPITSGRWYKVQAHLRFSAPQSVRVWVNDVLIVRSGTGFRFSNGATNIDQIDLGGTWGGGIGYVAPAGNQVSYGRTVMYRR